MLKKEYTKTGRSCRVTFSLPSDVPADQVFLVGDFNEWNPSKHPLKGGIKGDYKITISLKPGQTYNFRYLIDGERWENDWQADGYLSNPYGTENSIITV
jgi:1,4-alpha-glucan branching enzyme